MHDDMIVELYWKRKETAITETQNKYQKYLNTIAYNILANKEDCEESVNDTYLAAWNSMPPHRPTVLSTYLGKLTRRISIDIYRKKNCDKRKDSQYAISLDELAECVSGGNTPEESVDVKELARAINAFLKTLKADAKHVFVGRYYFMDSVKDIAEYCGLTQAKVKTLLFRTRNSLKDYLEKEGFQV